MALSPNGAANGGIVGKNAVFAARLTGGAC
jgi:hypothetical protein